LVTTHPEIAKQWHPTLNYPITPKDTSKGRMEKYWWKCDKKDDHVFEDSPNARTSSKTNCPICSGKRVVKSNCLATTHPEIAKQWHPTLNGKNTIYNIIAGSGKKVWWKCDKGEDHEWLTAVSHRATGTACPFCCNQKINIENSLQTLNPNLAKEWHPSENGNLTPLNFGQGSSQKVWWRCNDNNEHEWNAKISDRSNGNGCPSCAKYGFDR
jgi:hypothetical protein